MGRSGRILRTHVHNVERAEAFLVAPCRRVSLLDLRFGEPAVLGNDRLDSLQTVRGSVILDTQTLTFDGRPLRVLLMQQLLVPVLAGLFNCDSLHLATTLL